MRSAQFVRPHPRAPEIPVSGRRPRTLEAAVLQLQRSVGNAAVVRLLAREPEGTGGRRTSRPSSRGRAATPLG